VASASTDPHATNPSIVLIHGLWMTPRSWEHWKERYERRGYEVITPAYPGFEVEVEALREDPSPIADASLPDTIAHLESVIRGLDRPPFLMGHSFGGLLLQLLLDRGLGAAGVAIDSAPPEGIHKAPPAQFRALFPAFENPANRHRAVPFTAKHFHYAFTNTLSDEESADHVMPPAVNRSNFEHYKSAAHTDYKEFEGRSHYTLGQPGWEDVADYALDWCNVHTGRGALATA
jgi:alpha-beta hydrolase superfamily lysophospholipase